MCDTTFTYVWRDSYMCVTRLIHMNDMTHTYVCHDFYICVTRFICVCDKTHTYTYMAWLIHICDLTHIYVRLESYICVAWLIHTQEKEKRGKRAKQNSLFFLSLGSLCPSFKSFPCALPWKKGNREKEKRKRFPFTRDGKRGKSWMLKRYCRVEIAKETYNKGTRPIVLEIHRMISITGFGIVSQCAAVCWKGTVEQKSQNRPILGGQDPLCSWFCQNHRMISVTVCVAVCCSVLQRNHATIVCGLWLYTRMTRIWRFVQPKVNLLAPSIWHRRILIYIYAYMYIQTHMCIYKNTRTQAYAYM